MNGKNICVVLCHPDESRNVGSVCRAMANNDVYDLRIVGCRTDYDDEQVKTLAHAEKALTIWQETRFYDSLGEATQDCIVAAGTTRRRGKKRKNFLMFPEEFARHMAKNLPVVGDTIEPSGTTLGEIATSEIVSSTVATSAVAPSEIALIGTTTSTPKTAKIAVIFGNERTGLTDEELDVCTIGVNIPSSEEFGSLNLSHAVQVVLYTLFREYDCNQKKNLLGKNFENVENVVGYTPVNLARLDKTVCTIADSLQKIGFFKVAGRDDMEHFWRGVLSRASISEGEAQYIEKMFSKAAGLARK